MKEIEGQISLFEFIEPIKEQLPLLLPCDSCGYIKQGCCDYPVTPDDYCILGDKWILRVKPGNWVESDMIGEKLTFDEIAESVGKIIVMDKSTVSHEWYKVVLVEKIVMVENNTQRRLIYYDGEKQRGLVNEMWFDENVSYPARAYRLKKYQT